MTKDELLGDLNAAIVALKSRDQNSFEMRVIGGLKAAMDSIETDGLPFAPADIPDASIDAALSEFYDVSPRRDWNEAQRVAMRKALAVSRPHHSTPEKS